MGRRVLRRHTWGYSVCLCPIKRTPGLYGLTDVKKISTKIFRIGPYLLYQTAFRIKNYTRIHGERLSAEVEHA